MRNFKINSYWAMLIGLFLILPFSCSKDYLEKKSDQSLLVPTTVKDMQALLDNVGIMNNGPALHSLASDDFEVSSETLRTFVSAAERNAYVWKADIYENSNAADWNRLYQQVFYANVVLSGLEKMQEPSAQTEDWKRLRGSALFHRAFAFFQLAEEFCGTYVPNTAASMMGIPLKLRDDVNERPGRGSLKEVYDRVETDLTEAEGLLPLRQDWLTRPGKLSVWALLARIHLSMSNYTKAMQYADLCLGASPSLLDYNTLNAAAARPIAARGVEVIYNYFLSTYAFTVSVGLGVAPDLVQSYGTNDLRRSIFLRDRGNGVFNFKGNYSGTSTVFSGLATDEVYLIRSECRARLDNLAGAMEDLNALMVKRWNNKVAYVPMTATDRQDALTKILRERRKELISRGTRWSDLKRLNLDASFAVSINRRIDNVDYQLLPNSNRYLFPIPKNEIDASGIEQNAR